MWNWFARPDDAVESKGNKVHPAASPPPSPNISTFKVSRLSLEVDEEGNITTYASWPLPRTAEQLESIIQTMTTLIWALSKGKFIQNLKTAVDDFCVKTNAHEVAQEVQRRLDELSRSEHGPIIKPTSVFGGPKQ